MGTFPSVAGALAEFSPIPKVINMKLRLDSSLLKYIDR